MFGEGYTSSYLNYAIFLWMVSGMLILQIDVKGFKLSGLNKELKVSRIIGWLNIIVGIVLLLAELVLQ
ncbi:MAG: CLC_0170 family protein [Candidatus Pristimantibacillus sp.]